MTRWHIDWLFKIKLEHQLDLVKCNKLPVFEIWVFLLNFVILNKGQVKKDSVYTQVRQIEKFAQFFNWFEWLRKVDVHLPYFIFLMGLFLKYEFLSSDLFTIFDSLNSTAILK